MTDTGYQFAILGWDEAMTLVTPIRKIVFIEEQNVSPELEWDGMDNESRHAIARTSDGTVIGCGRLLRTGQVGRMAVLKKYRHHGVGSGILAALESEATQLQYPSVFLHAQIQALPFYKKHNYQSLGDIFDEAGIPHQKCIKYL